MCCSCDNSKISSASRWKRLLQIITRCWTFQNWDQSTFSFVVIITSPTFNGAWTPLISNNIIICWLWESRYTFESALVGMQLSRTVLHKKNKGERRRKKKSPSKSSYVVVYPIVVHHNYRIWPLNGASSLCIQCNISNEKISISWLSLKGCHWENHRTQMRNYSILFVATGHHRVGHFRHWIIINCLPEHLQQLVSFYSLRINIHRRWITKWDDSSHGVPIHGPWFEPSKSVWWLDIPWVPLTYLLKIC